MNRFLMFSGVLMSVSLALQAKQVEGRVVDLNQKPIDAVTVVMQLPDSSFVSATVTDSLGYFHFDQSSDCYRLIYQHILYHTVEKSGCEAHVGTIAMQPQEYALSEVVVHGERPLVQVESGALAYDAEVLAERTTATTAYESILRVPGVSEQNNQLVLVGAQDVNILINGKPSSMNREQLINLLKSMPVSQVEEIKVMYNAPAHYRVRGAALNIVLKEEKSQQLVWRGEVRGDFMQSNYTQGGGNVNLSYVGKKITADVSYSPVYAKSDANDMDLFSYHTLGDKTCEIVQHDRGTQQAVTHNLRAGLDYAFTDQNKLSVAYVAALKRRGKSINISEGNFSDAMNRKTSQSQMHNVSADYTSGFGLNIGLDYTRYDSPARQDFTDRSETLQHFLVDDRQRINRWNVYAGQTHVLPRDWNFNYGIDFTFADERSGQTYLMLDGERPASDVDTHIRESTYNFYAGTEKVFSDKWSFALSVAGEYYRLEEYEKWAIYPTFQLTYQLNPAHIMQLGFSSDKTYPNYWTLQNTVNYLNGYTKILGNPGLRPSSDYTANLTYIFRGKYIAQLSYSYTKDYFAQLPYQSQQELSLIYQFVNFRYQQNVNMAFIIPFSVKHVWNANLTLSGNYRKEKCDPYHEIRIDRGRFIGAVVLNNTFRLCSQPDIRFELNGMYVSSPLQGLMTLTDVWKIDAGLKWTFANRKAELKLSGNDLFNSSMPDVYTDYRGQKLRMRMLETTRNFTLSFTYRFGGYQKKQQKEVDTSRFGY